MNIYLPEVVDLAIDQGLVLSLDIIDVFDVTGVKMLLHHEAQEAVVWSVCYNKKKHKQILKHSIQIRSPKKKFEFKCK